MVLVNKLAPKKGWRSVEEVLRLVDALQFTEKHGEVCPANWQKGKKAMKPNEAGLKDFFVS